MLHLSFFVGPIFDPSLYATKTSLAAYGTVRNCKFALGSSGPIAKDVWGKLALLKRLRSRPLEFHGNWHRSRFVMR